MELVLAIFIGWLVASGVYLVLRARTFPVVMGLTLITYAVNLLLFASGGISNDAAPVLTGEGPYMDPLPQALVLTAIVIGFAMTAFVVVLSLRALGELGDDHVDGDKLIKQDEAKSEEQLGEQLGEHLGERHD